MCARDLVAGKPRTQRTVSSTAPLLADAPALDLNADLDRDLDRGQTPVKASRDTAKCVLCDGDAVVASLSLVNAALGAGVLAYPFAFMSAGIVAASLCTVILGSLSYVSLCIIFHSMAVARQRERQQQQQRERHRAEPRRRRR